MFLAGAQNLEAKKEWINELNVFPVPDGDTGTNMSMTILSAAREVAALKDPSMKDLCKAISSGSLRGARGNSGVILSQLFRGFTKGIQDHEEVNVAILAEAFQRAVETAYKAVMKPKEGTILTVAKGGADKAMELWQDGVTDLDEFFSKIIEHEEYVLSRTPEMLPVLKEAGVVDSGGQGLVVVLRGAYDAFLGKEIDYEAIKPSAGVSSFKPSAQGEADIKFGYCTEFIIMLEHEASLQEENQLKAYLETIGDSIVCVADDDIIKVHVHTNHPGQVFEKALTFGSLSNMKVDNMRLEHQEKLFKESEMQAASAKQEMPHKDVGFISVSAGEGLDRIFKELGVDYMIEGGQTMNPSTEDMLEAIEQVNADTIFIFPNNKNIILAANQAQALTEDKKIIVVPTKTIPQGITSIINYIPEMTPEENERTMLEEMEHVKTGQITYAVRDTSIDGKEIHQGDYMGIGDHGILSVSQDMSDTVLTMLSEMIDDSTELVSVYYGSDVKEEEANAMKARIEERFPSCDCELQFGGQPVYYYIVSAE
ncbi:MAG: DAK2 domain-containing protein [Lachnospiraceae bacterium]|nr:DAK2 domain-containing protein [Lachnospiraceae bacterium]